METISVLQRTSPPMNSTFLEAKRKYISRLWLCLEVALICVFIIGTWSLGSLPVIFYHLKVPEDSDGAQNRSSLSRNGTGHQPSNPNGTRAPLWDCTYGFYRENESSFCMPSCYTWTQYNKRWSIILDVVEITTLSFKILVAAAIILLSCLFHKRMLIFPAIFIVYFMITVLIYVFIVLVGHMDRNGLFCSSKSLLKSVIDVTPFCVISGILFMYATYQGALWWLFHTSTLFWKVVFPFHAQSFQNVKYIHLACVILGIVIPLVPIITTMADFAVDLQKQNENSSFKDINSLFLSRGLGFGPDRFPASVCFARDPDAVFYSYVFHVDIILLCGCTMLIFIFWTVSKRKKGKKNVKFNFGIAEKKLLFVLCFSLLAIVMYLITYIISARFVSKRTEIFLSYFFCEQMGHNPSNPCSRSEIEDLNYPSVVILVHVLDSFSPCTYLIYVVNIPELKKMWRERKWFT